MKLYEYIFPLVFYNLATSKLCICKFVTLFPLFSHFFVVEDSSGRKTVSNRGSTSLPLVSTIAECTLPCKDLRVTRRGIAACTCLHHGGGQTEKTKGCCIYPQYICRAFVSASTCCLTACVHACCQLIFVWLSSTTFVKRNFKLCDKNYGIN